MNEALMSGLPVFMTDISPNNFILPKEWLIESQKIGKLMTRMTLDVYEADARTLANYIDNYVKLKDKSESKKKAVKIGLNNFDINKLKNQYLNIINNM